MSARETIWKEPEGLLGAVRYVRWDSLGGWIRIIDRIPPAESPTDTATPTAMLPEVKKA